MTEGVNTGCHMGAAGRVWWVWYGMVGMVSGVWYGRGQVGRRWWVVGKDTEVEVVRSGWAGEGLFLVTSRSRGNNCHMKR